MSFYSVFSMKLDGAEPSIRYFLVKYLWLFGDKDVVTKGVKALAKEVGVTDRIVSRALAFLVLNQYFERLKVVGDERKRGRPGSYYVLSNKLLGLLNSYAAQNREPIHSPLIAALMKDERSSRSVKSPTVLACSRCYFLCVLLFRADKFGVVTGVGSAELRRYTGLSDQQIKRYTADLISASYLVACFKGFNAKSLSGRVTNTYVLNPCWHQSLKPVGYELISFGAQCHGLVERAIDMAKSLQMMVELNAISADEFTGASKEWFAIYDLPSFDPIKFFAASEIVSSWAGRPIEAFIQWRIYDLVSLLLTQSISSGVFQQLKDGSIEAVIVEELGDFLFSKSKLVLNQVVVRREVLFLIKDIIQKMLSEISAFLEKNLIVKVRKSIWGNDRLIRGNEEKKIYRIYPRYVGSDNLCILITNDAGFEYVQSSKTLHIPLIP